MNAHNPYAPPQAEVADIDGPTAREEAPALWNPAAAASWSLILTPIFGAVLQMKNWQALGEPEKAASAKTWVWISSAFFVGLIVLGAFMPNSKGLDGLSRILAFALLIAWYYASGKPQQNYVKARFGKDYPRRGWAKPLGFAVLGVFGIFVVAIVVGLVVGVASSVR